MKVSLYTTKPFGKAIERSPSRYSYPMPIGDDRLSRLRKLPVALSIPVTVKVGQMRCTSWSM